MKDRSQHDTLHKLLYHTRSFHRIAQESLVFTERGHDKDFVSKIVYLKLERRLTPKNHFQDHHKPRTYFSLRYLTLRNRNTRYYSNRKVSDTCFGMKRENKYFEARIHRYFWPIELHILNLSIYIRVPLKLVYHGKRPKFRPCGCK